METLNYKELLESPMALQQVEVREPEAGPQTVPQLIHTLLLAIGEDPGREGLARTPERVSRALGEILSGYHTDMDELVNGAIFDSDYKEMVVVRSIEYYSLCEHHLLPFFGRAHVAYIPDGKIIGLSKIPRLVDMFARRLQVQERMTTQIAEALEGILKPKGVAVQVEGCHLCARMRGVKKEQADMVTRVTLGAFEHDRDLRQEFFSQLPV